ncbi:MAG TPA: hypothetical protein VK196_02700 [Magnetospirillum sp.]|nr:hypothetical protein [Magnetospirillum sp.]
MDRNVRVRFFTVHQVRDNGVNFSDALRRIDAIPELADRELEVEPEVILRMERMEERRGLISGEFVRRQTENLPPRASEGEPLAQLGVDSIGHCTAFAYDPALSVIALQMARNGVTPIRVMVYVAQLLHIGGYQSQPIPTAEGWDKLQRGSLRALVVRVANPANLHAVNQRQRSVKEGLAAMKTAAGTTYVEAAFSMGRGQPDITERGHGLLRWFFGEQGRGRGDISKLKAHVAPDDGGSAEWLNLLDYHMGGNAVLDLPQDDPNANYRERVRYVRRVFADHRDELQRMNERAAE